MSHEYDVEDFKKKFPKLSDELLSGKTKSLKLHVEIIDPWRGYVPTVVDYIRRCRTVEEAFEVVDYLVRRNELPVEEGEKIKEMLRSNGIEAFGGRKEDDYYYKEARRYWNTIKRRLLTNIEELEEDST